MEFRQDDASLPRLGGIVERVGWLDRLKSGCEAKGYALEVALMRVAWLHLGDLASDEISPCAWRSGARLVTPQAISGFGRTLNRREVTGAIRRRPERQRDFEEIEAA